MSATEFWPAHIESCDSETRMQAAMSNEAPAKPPIDPASVKEGRDVRRRPGGRGCRVERVSDDRLKVLVKDNGRCFWVHMDTLVRDWY